MQIEEMLEFCVMLLEFWYICTSVFLLKFYSMQICSVSDAHYACYFHVYYASYDFGDALCGQALLSLRFQRLFEKGFY